MSKDLGRIVMLAGNHMRDGYIDNFNRPRRFACWLQDGKLELANESMDGPEWHYPGESRYLVLNCDGDLAFDLAPNYGLFSPAEGELIRIGLETHPHAGNWSPDDVQWSSADIQTGAEG